MFGEQHIDRSRRVAVGCEDRVIQYDLGSIDQIMPMEPFDDRYIHHLHSFCFFNSFIGISSSHVLCDK